MPIGDDPRAAIGGAPIPGAAPAGENIRYEPDFTALQDTVTQMDSKGPLAVNWRQVATDGCEILQNRSKDLLVAAYVTLALSRTEGYRGLAIGLTITADMLAAFWPDLEPPVRRERARVQMLEWVVQRVAPLVVEQPPTEADAADVIEAYEAIDRLQQVLDEKLVKETVALGDLVRPLREHARAAESAIAEREAAAAPAGAAAVPAAAAPQPTPPSPLVAPAPPPPLVAPAPPPPPAPALPPAAPAPLPAAAAPAAAAPAIPAATAVAPPADAAAIDLALSRLQSVMLDVAKGVRAASNRDPRGYVLLRQAIWLVLSRLPPHQRGRTLLPAPPGDRLAQIAALQQAGNHAVAVAMIEDNIQSAPFWLDAHRLSANSLEALGADYEAARTAVAASVAALIRRFPDLIDLAFGDGTPFANEATRKWLAEMQGNGGAGHAGAAGNGVGSNAEPGWLTAGREARERARAGKAKEGVAVLARGVAAASTARERFFWQVAQVEYCLDFGMVAPALALLDHLDEVVARHQVEDWEPGLAVRISGLMHQCLMHADARTLRRDDIRLPLLEAHRTRLCRLDMVAAAGAMNF